jgi:hypothetical protein
MELILIVAGIALLVYLRNKWLSTPSRVSIPDQTPKAETYVFSRPLTILEGSGAGLPVDGGMVTIAIKLAKLFKEAGPSNIAALRRQEFKVVPIK